MCAMTAGLVQGEAEGDKGSMDWLGWRGLLQGVCQLVNDQLMAALDGSQQMLACPQQVTRSVNTNFCAMRQLSMSFHIKERLLVGSAYINLCRSSLLACTILSTLKDACFLCCHAFCRIAALLQ